MTQLTANNISPQPINWFKNGALPTPLPEQAEWSTEEKNHLALLAQADLLFLIAQLFAPPSTKLQILIKVEIPDITELLYSSNLPEQKNIAETYQEIRQQAQKLNLDTWVAEYKRLFEDANVDHLTTELELIAKLLVKLVQAKNEKFPSSPNFEQLGKWLSTFCERLTKTSTLILYQELAKLLLSTWTGILKVNQLPLPTRRRD